jgi:hypothetical protein
MPGNPYGPCDGPGDCPLQGSNCVFGTCAPPCNAIDMDCPPAPPPSPGAECTVMQCRVQCAEMGMCPPDMTCVGVDFGLGNQDSCVYEPP